MDRSLDRRRFSRSLTGVVAVSLAVFALAALANAATPKPHGIYVGELVNTDKVQLTVAADGRSATLTLGCSDLGETYPFPRFPITKGAFNTTLPFPGSPGIADATLRGRFTSATQASIVVDEHPNRSDAARYICFGITSPATLTLKAA